MAKKAETSSQSRGRSRVVTAVVLLCSTLFAVFVADRLLRWRYAEPARKMSAEVAAIQEHLQLHPKLGFTWKPNISADHGIVLRLRDVEFEPLSTDEFGFKNSPEAIARRDAGESPRVIGLGDSFMELGNAYFHERFDSEGIFYYNLAVHRHTTVQGAFISQQIALPLSPEVIVLGVFENDFAEYADFIRWQGSEMDWFQYHSGTWCGPPVTQDRFKHFFTGFQSAFAAARNRVRDGRMTFAGPSHDEVFGMASSIAHAIANARYRGVRFVVVFIPSRATAIDGDTLEAQAYDALHNKYGEFIDEKPDAVVDLRRIFQSHPDPASLYYVEDAHWNEAGMNLAFEALNGAVGKLLSARSSTSNSETPANES